MAAPKAQRDGIRDKIPTHLLRSGASANRIAALVDMGKASEAAQIMTARSKNKHIYDASDAVAIRNMHHDAKSRVAVSAAEVDAAYAGCKSAEKEAGIGEASGMTLKTA